MSTVFPYTTLFRSRLDFVVAAVLDRALVEIVPCGLEKRGLRNDVLVGVEDDHLGAGLRLLEVGRNLAGALVGPRRAAEGRPGDPDDAYAAVGHRLELLPQRDCRRAGLPRVQDGLLRLGVLALYCLVHEIH